MKLEHSGMIFYPGEIKATKEVVDKMWSDKTFAKFVGDSLKRHVCNSDVCVIPTDDGNLVTVGEAYISEANDQIIIVTHFSLDGNYTEIKFKED